MAVRNQVAEVFIKVVADSREAIRSIGQNVKALEAQARQQAALADAAEKSANALEKVTAKQNKALDEAAKKTRDSLKARLKDSDYYKKEEARLKHEMALKEKERISRERSIKSLEKEAKRVTAVQRDYQDFISRSHRENSRFFDRLSRQDFTRSFVENFRRGMQKGKIITAKYHQDENYLQAMARSLGLAATALDRVKSYAERAAEGFYKLQMIGMSLQGVLSIVGGVIGDLIGGFMSFVAVAGQLGVSLVAVGGAFLSVMAGMIGAKTALAGVGRAVGNLWNGQQQYNRSLVQARIAMKNLRFEAESAALAQEGAAIALTRARLRFAAVQDLPKNNLVYREALLDLKQAELGVRRAKAASDDIKTEIKQGGQLAVVAANSPFKGLTKSQISFTKYLVTLKPQIQALKEVAAQSFLPPLQNAINTMVKYGFPLFERGLRNVNTSMGKTVNSIADTFKDPAFAKGFLQFTEDSKPIIEDFGKAISNALSGVVNTLNAAAPLTKRFSDWIVESTEDFKKWSSEGLADGSLADYFKTAGDVASKVGKIFGTIFQGIKNDMKAAFPPGGEGGGWSLLKWMQSLADNFKNWTGSPKFSKWLNDATNSLTTTIDTIGAFAHVFIDLAGDPDIKQFWLTIRKAAPDFIYIFTEGAKAAPAMADLFNNFIHFVSVLSESGAIKAFFTGLSNVFGFLAKVVDKLAPLINFLAELHGWLLVLYAASVLFRNGLKIMLGYGEKTLRVLGGGQALVTRTWASGTAAIKLQNMAIGGQIGALKRLQIRLKSVFGQNYIQRSLKGERNFTQLRAQGLALYGLNEKTLKSSSKSGSLQRSGFRLLESELIKARNAGVVAVGRFVAGAEAGASGLRSMYYGSYLLYKMLNGIQTTFKKIGGVFSNAFKKVFGSIQNVFPKITGFLSALARPITNKWSKGLAQIKILEEAVTRVTGKETKLNGVLKTRLIVQSLFNRSVFDTERIGKKNFEKLSSSLDKMKEMGLISSSQRKNAIAQMKDRRSLLYYNKLSLTKGMGIELLKFRFLTETALGRFIVKAATAFDTFKNKAITTFRKVGLNIAKFFVVKGGAVAVALLNGYVKALEGLIKLRDAFKSKLASLVDAVKTGFSKLSRAFLVAKGFGLSVLSSILNGYVKVLEGLIKFRDAFKSKINAVANAVKTGLIRLSQAFVIKTAPAALKILEYLGPIENIIRSVGTFFKLMYLNIRMDAFRLAIAIIKLGAKIVAPIVALASKVGAALNTLYSKIKSGFNSAAISIRAGLAKVATAFKIARLNTILAGINIYVKALEGLIFLRDRVKSIIGSVVSSIKASFTKLKNAFVIKATPVALKALEKIAPVTQAVQQTAKATKDSLIAASVPIKQGVARFGAAFKLAGLKAFSAGLSGYVKALEGLIKVRDIFKAKISPIISYIRTRLSVLTFLPFSKPSDVLKALPAIENSFNILANRVKAAALRAYAVIRRGMLQLTKAFVIAKANVTLAVLNGYIKVLEGLIKFRDAFKAKITSVVSSIKSGMARLRDAFILKMSSIAVKILNALVPIEIAIRKFGLKVELAAKLSALYIRRGMLQLTKAFVIAKANVTLAVLNGYIKVLEGLIKFRDAFKAKITSIVATVKSGMARLKDALILKISPIAIKILDSLKPIEVALRQFGTRIQLAAKLASSYITVGLLQLAKGVLTATGKVVTAMIPIEIAIRKFGLKVELAAKLSALYIRRGMLQLTKAFVIAKANVTLAVLNGYIKVLEGLIKFRDAFKAKITSVIDSVKSGMTRLKNAFIIAKGRVTLGILNGYIKVLEGLIKFRDAFKAKITSVIDSVKSGMTRLKNAFILKMAPIAVKILNALGPLEMALRRYAFPFQQLAATIKISMLSLGQMMIKDVSKVVIAVATKLINGYVSVLDKIIKFRDAFKSKINSVVSVIRTGMLKLSRAFLGVKLAGLSIVSSVLNGYVKTLEGLIRFRDAFKSKISSVVGGISSGFTRFSEAFKSKVSSAVGAVKSGLTRLRAALVGMTFWKAATSYWTMLDKIGNSFKAALGRLVSGISSKVVQASTAVKTALLQLSKAFMLRGRNAVAGTVTGYSNIISGLVKFKDSFVIKINSVVAAVKTGFSKLATAFKAVGGKVSGSFLSSYSQLVDKLQPIVSKITPILTNLKKKLKDTFSIKGNSLIAVGLNTVNTKLKNITSSSKLAQSAFGKLKTAMHSAFGPGSPVVKAFAPMETGIANLGKKIEKLTGRFKTFFRASKNYQTASYASGINQALDQATSPSRTMQVIGATGRGLGTAARFIGRNSLKLVGGGSGAVAGLGALAQTAATAGDRSAVSTTGDVLMAVGGAVSMFAPQVGVPIMVGAAIVSQIGKSMDAAAEKAKQLAIKSAVINVANQTNSSAAVANLEEAVGGVSEAVRLVNKYNSGGSGYAGLLSGAQAMTGTTFVNSGQGRDFVGALQGSLSSDTTLLAAIKTNKALYPVILRLGIAMQQQNQGFYKINTIQAVQQSASNIITKISGMLENDPKLTAALGKIKGIVVTNATGTQTELNKKQAEVFQTLLVNSYDLQQARIAAANADSGDSQGNRAAYQNAQYGLAKDILSGAYQSSTQEYRRLATSGYGYKENFYARDPRDGSIDYTKTVPLKDLIAVLKAQSIDAKNLDNPRAAPQIVIKGDATAAQKNFFTEVNKALKLAWANR